MNRKPSFRSSKDRKKAFFRKLKLPYLSDPLPVSDSASVWRSIGNEMETADGGGEDVTAHLPTLEVALIQADRLVRNLDLPHLNGPGLRAILDRGPPPSVSDGPPVDPEIFAQTLAALRIRAHTSHMPAFQILDPTPVVHVDPTYVVQEPPMSPSHMDIIGSSHPMMYTPPRTRRGLVGVVAIIQRLSRRSDWQHLLHTHRSGFRTYVLDVDARPGCDLPRSERRYIDGDPARSPNLAGYINSTVGTQPPRRPNVEWEHVGGPPNEFGAQDLEFYIATVAIRPIIAGDELFCQYMWDVDASMLIFRGPHFSQLSRRHQAASIAAGIMTTPATHEGMEDTDEAQDSLDDDADYTDLQHEEAAMADYFVHNKLIDGIFRLLAEKVLPDGSDVPKSRVEAKRVLKSIGMEYEVIHACPNDCILYRNEHQDKIECHVCNEGRYREDTQGKQIPKKVLRRFPLIPRLRHMFRCRPISDLMTWHRENRSQDDFMRLVVDSPAMSHIEDQWPEFARDPRHLRFGLASDGVSPYGIQSSTYSIWPVVLINYNIPPWLATKKGFVILALLIPVEELQQLWNGVDDVYDGRSHENRIGRDRWFTLKGILMWTMHDYPGYGHVSGLQTKGYCACPTCSDKLPSIWSTHLRKVVYMDYSTFLPLDHPMRGAGPDRNSKPPPEPVDVAHWMNRWEQVQEGSLQLWESGLRRWSVLHDLPYCKDLLIGHLLDPMHIEGNVVKSLVKHMYGEKDTIAGRRACEELNVHPQNGFRQVKMEEKSCHMLLGC
ncbi:hypothetical protein R1sor_002856 [Riccia sorocarpa]|uniref:SET domain-containing protein n=1 Tax=Riccia sorocarpa TaxID=122646 RepID=A0ABD3H3W3_9MARC